MRKTTANRKEEIIGDLVAARDSILSLARRLTHEQREKFCVGSWTIMDLMAHLAGWDFTNRGAVEEILRGLRPGFLDLYDKDWRSYNASLVEQYRKETFAEVLAEVEQSHQELVAYLQSLSPEVILEGKSPAGQGRPVTIRNLLKAEASDERKHAEQIQAYFEPGPSRISP